MKNAWRVTWLFCLVLQACSSDEPAPTGVGLLNASLRGATGFCTVTNARTGDVLGSGDASALSYNGNGVTDIRVTCGTLSAIVPAGRPVIALSRASTQVSLAVGNHPVPTGIDFIVNRVAFLSGETLPSTSITGVLPFRGVAAQLAEARAVSEIPAQGEKAADSLLRFVESLAIANDFKATRQERLIALIVLLMQIDTAVVLDCEHKENPFPKCESDPALLVSDSILVQDGTSVGFPGKLVARDALTSATNYNDPSVSPSPKDLNSVRAALTFDAVVSLLNAFDDSRLVKSSEVQALLVKQLGYTYYTEDENGVVSSIIPGNSDIKRAINRFVERAEMGSWTGTEDKVWLPYNPSGGWFLPILAKPGAYQAQCYPTTSPAYDGLSTCSIDPERANYDADSNKVTFDDAGSHILVLDYRDGGYTNKDGSLKRASLRTYPDGLPVFSKLRVPVSFTTLQPPGAFEYRHWKNPYYDEALDPATVDGFGFPTIPFVNATFRAAFPALEPRTETGNAYVHYAPEVSGRLGAGLLGSAGADYLSPFEFVFAVRLLQSMAALPIGEKNVSGLVQGTAYDLPGFSATLKSYFDDKAREDIHSETIASTSFFLGDGYFQINKDTTTCSRPRIGEVLDPYCRFVFEKSGMKFDRGAAVTRDGMYIVPVYFGGGGILFSMGEAGGEVNYVPGFLAVENTVSGSRGTFFGVDGVRVDLVAEGLSAAVRGDKGAFDNKYNGVVGQLSLRTYFDK